MFDSLSEKLEGIFKKLKGKGYLREEDIFTALKEIKIALLEADDIFTALKEIKIALLEADVNFKVVKDFVEKVK
jgi:signal recognition particle subunit SRP54